MKTAADGQALGQWPERGTISGCTSFSILYADKLTECGHHLIYILPFQKGGKISHAKPRKTLEMGPFSRRDHRVAS